MRKIGSVFVKIFAGMLITAIVLIICMDKDSGGLGVNGFLSFLMWVGLMFLLIKFHVAVSVGVSVALYLLLLFMKDGASQVFMYSAGLCIVAAIAIAYLKHRVNVGKTVIEHQRQGEKCCPHCGSTNIQFVQGHTETNSNIEWNYDKGDWYRDNVVKSKYFDAHYQCEDCGKEFN